jgi:hypothetical protein
MHMMGAKKTILKESKIPIAEASALALVKWVQRSKRNWNWRDTVPLKMSYPIIEVKSKARFSGTPSDFLTSQQIITCTLPSSTFPSSPSAVIPLDE